MKRLLGLDNMREEYAYTDDPVLGHTSAKRASERWVRTTCGYCSVGCGMEIGVRDGRAVAVRGWDGHPVSDGVLCPKGLSEHETLAAPGRALYPLRKRKGRFERVAWNEAIGEMVSQIRYIQARDGAQSFGVISTGQLVTEEFYTLGKLVQLGFGSNNYDGNTTLCMSSAVAGYKRSFGSDGPPGCYDDLRAADVILLIGANIADNHPILCRHFEHNRSALKIVADPRVTKTAMLADLHLPLKPRTDIALMNGIARVLIDESLIDRPYIDRHTEGFEELNQFLAQEWPLERAAAVTGIAAETIARVAREYGRARSGFLAWTMGVNHSTQGVETVNAICNLSLLTGKIGRPGSAPFSITGQCNAMGTREAGFASSLPGYRDFANPEHRAELGALWHVDAARIPSSRGMAYPDIIRAAAKGEIKALWIIATNPVVSYPNKPELERALKNVEFLVVQDGFHPTPTSAFAHLVLPAAIWGEKEGIYTNSERRVSKVNKAVEAPGEARSDFDIFLALAKGLGRRRELFPDWSAPADAFAEWKRVSKGRLCDYSGMTYERIEAEGGLLWPFPEPAAETSPDAARASAGASRLYTDGVFEHPDGKARLLSIDWQPFPDQPDDQFPLVLNTGRTVEHWHTRTKTAQVAILERLSPNAWLEMNPADASTLGLRPHQRVDIESRRGRVNGVELRITQIIAPGQVFMPFHFFETNVNEVTQDAFDPISREPNYKQCAVRVRGQQ